MSTETIITDTKVFWDKAAQRLYVYNSDSNSWELFVVAADAVTNTELTAALALKVAIAGDTMTGALQLPNIGVNATPDATNKLTVKSSAVLLDNIGNGVQLKVNKHAAGDTGSILYQDNFSGRAEIGLTGDDNFHFKVSPDGSAWTDALVVDKTTGALTVATAIAFPNGSASAPPVAFNTNYGLFYDTTNTAIGFGANGSQVANMAATGLVISIAGGGTSQVNVLGEGITQQNFSRYSANTGGPILRLAKGRGTIASRAVPSLNDVLGQLAWAGYNGTGNTSGAMFQGTLIETGTVSSTAMGSKLELNIAPIGSGTLTTISRYQASYQAHLGPVTMGAVAAPATSALLDLSSTTGALALPSMTTTQKTALTAANRMMVYDSTLGGFQKFEGGAWVPLGQGLALNATDIGTTTRGKGEFSQLGVNAANDATNKLSVSSSAILFNNIGNGVQVKLNKNAAGDTASELYQTGFSGRAEVGLTGDDNFHFKVSADGSTFFAAITLDKSSGKAWFGSDPGGSDQVRIGGALTINAATLITTKTSFTNGAAAATGTLTNAPAAGNPTKWIPINDNGTTRYLPAW